MTAQTRGAQELLAARLDDHLARAARGSIAVSRFLTPGEQKLSDRLLTARGVRDRALFWGGYAGAERKCLFVLPEFYADFPDLMPPPDTDPAAMIPDDEASAVAAVRISGSGFRKLSHRDHLGALLGMGLERDAIGDIALQNDYEAVVFCSRHLVPFLLSNLRKVAADTVRCREYIPDGKFTDGRKYRPIIDTVASPRLDCVVAALTNLSREDAQNAVRSGLVEVDFDLEERTDRILTAPATVSIRGYGRYILRSFDGETRKGRIRLKADHLI